MKFSVGYQYPDEYSEERFPEILQDYSDSTAELYFAPGNEPGARSPAAKASGLEENEAWEILTEDLIETRKMGIKLNLLFNANCLGAGSISKELQNRVVKITGDLMDICPLDTVTTASWFIAGVLKKHFPQLEIRASVNMKLGTLEALNYASERFDGFCIQRDINYHPETLRQISDWAKANNKNICLLANSGCLRNCAVQTFHDNLVAHLNELRQSECCMDQDPIFCRRFYADDSHKEEYLCHSTLIRPEDVCHYEDIVPMLKLATRTHSNPRLVLEAYTSGKFTGNFFDLTEPGHGIFFRGKVLDNARITPEYWQVKSRCKENCSECGFCKKVMENALISCTELS